MMPNSDTDYKKLFSELIKKQMLVLGPDITLAKVKNVIGLSVDVNGDVIKLEGDPQQMLQGLINQFVELSGMIVKKTMESILTSYPGMMAMATSSAFGGGLQTSTQQPLPNASTQAATSSIPASQTTTQTSSPNDTVVSSSIPHEPPPITAVHFDGAGTKVEDKEKNASGPQPFTSQEMQDLNKALEELANAPLSTETQPAAQTTPAQV